MNEAFDSYVAVGVASVVRIYVEFIELCFVLDVIYFSLRLVVVTHGTFGAQMRKRFTHFSPLDGSTRHITAPPDPSTPDLLDQKKMRIMS